ncbi:MAG: cation-translocating P-type ATPase [Planctomycetota bacterium]|nr:cation-translocating P-type ATPase [Planctomycetota bacterium]
MPDAPTRWHGLATAAAADILKTDLAAGLSAGEAEARLARCGRNALPEGKKQTLLGMFLDQFRDFLVLILVAAAVISLAMQELTDALVIIAILILNATLGVAQQRRAGRALEALKKLSVPECEVIRDGRTVRVSSELLVPGDLVILREGALVPADLRLTESHNLRIDESSLTGESEAVEKVCEPLAEDLPLPDRLNMAYAGTVATYGRGRGIVAATGMNREIGRIAQLLEEQAPDTTPLQKKLAGFGKLVGILILGVCALTFALGVLRGEAGLWDMFLIAVSLAVAAIPEGLPAIVTVVLALGVHRMSRQKAIVRKLPAVETLGCATYICTDKTGTLTENRMSVTTVAPSDALADTQADGMPTPLLRGHVSTEADNMPSAERAGHATPEDGVSPTHLLEVAVLCNDAHVEVVGAERRRFGDPTELALVEYAETQGIDAEALRRLHPRLGEVPFDSQRKRMSTLHEIGGRRQMLVKGAPDVLLALCASYERKGEIVPLGAEERARAHEQLESMANRALRVLAFAWKDVGNTDRLSAADEANLVFAGLVGMRDAPRPEARVALAEARSAGIKIVMITGDNIRTARAIADELGMIQPGDEVLSGQDLEQIPDDELARRMPHLRVFARVWPEQKLKIIRALQAHGEVAAMTGDGVNDAPALQKADIGVAMGITGTDVAKGAADVILMDDNFATIVKAIEEGRVIFDNIRKFVTFLLACNFGEILCIFIPVLIGLGSPLKAVQILLINLVTDGLPALALGIDTAEPDIMRRRPRRLTEGILSSYYLKVVGFNGALFGIAAVACFLIGRRVAGPEVAATMTFVTLAFDELWRAYGWRSAWRNFWQVSPWTNLWLLGAVALSAAVVVATVVLPPVRAIFSTAPLTLAQWGIALGFSLIPFTAYEIWKAIRRRWFQPD